MIKYENFIPLLECTSITLNVNFQKSVGVGNLLRSGGWRGSGGGLGGGVRLSLFIPSSPQPRMATPLSAAHLISCARVGVKLGQIAANVYLRRCENRGAGFNLCVSAGGVGGLRPVWG